MIGSLSYFIGIFSFFLGFPTDGLGIWDTKIMRTIEGKGEFKEILGVWGHTHLFQSYYVDKPRPHWDLASEYFVATLLGAEMRTKKIDFTGKPCSEHTGNLHLPVPRGFRANRRVIPGHRAT